MNGFNKVEKMSNGKPRKAWDESTGRKGDKRNKTQRNRDDKRKWCD